MTQIFANNVITNNGVTHWIAVLNETVIENMRIMFSRDNQQKIAGFMAQRQSFHNICRYHQFIVLLQAEPGLGLSMKISDYQNNVDLALDDYNTFLANGWDKEDRDKIMTIFADIQKNPLAAIKVIIKDPIS